MITSKIIAHNIISSLGFYSEENFTAVRRGRSGLKLLDKAFEIPERVAVATVDKRRLDSEFESYLNLNKTKYTVVEKMALLSSFKALSECDIDIASPRTLFVLSTTKGNISLVDNVTTHDTDNVYLWNTAEMLTRYYHNTNLPVVISNACISGLSAIIVASRLINSGIYDTAIIVGVDALSKFVISGFQSFKALSSTYCRPFDSDRVGLNLGEGAATIVMQSVDESELNHDDLIFHSGAITNDANHISGPSRTGEGLYLAMQQSLCQANASPVNFTGIDFINAHGTATMYNDEMESIAITRCKMNEIPIISLKGYFGHTLGCAGVLESVISCLSLQNDILLESLFFEHCGTTNKINVNTQQKNISLHSYMKTISGFGGCNACGIFTKI